MKNLIPMIIVSGMLFYLFASVTELHGQNQCDKQLQKLLYYAIYVMDEPNYKNTNYMDNVIKKYNILDSNQVYCLSVDSSILKTFYLTDFDSIACLKKPEMMDFLSYRMQLFRVGAYYVLHIKACDNYAFDLQEDVWLRANGFRENDMKLLWDELRRQGLTKGKIKRLVNTWSTAGGLFSEVNWQCMFKGYLKHNTNYDCFISQSYSKERLWCGDLDIHASFSKTPLKGCFRTRRR